MKYKLSSSFLDIIIIFLKTRKEKCYFLFKGLISERLSFIVQQQLLIPQIALTIVLSLIIREVSQRKQLVSWHANKYSLRLFNAVVPSKTKTFGPYFVARMYVLLTSLAHHLIIADFLMKLFILH